MGQMASKRLILRARDERSNRLWPSGCQAPLWLELCRERRTPIACLDFWFCGRCGVIAALCRIGVACAGFRAGDARSGSP